MNTAVPILVGLALGGGALCLVAILAVLCGFTSPAGPSFGRARHQRRENRILQQRARACEDARLARQADEQDQWWLAGDPRGTYGRRYASLDEEGTIT